MKKALIAVAVAMALPVTVMAWEPAGDVSIIVAYKAGSGTDTGARVLSTQASKILGKTFIIQNLPGGDGKIGWTKLINSKPDGSTIGYINIPTFTTLAVQPGAPFSVADVIPIANHLTESGVVVVKTDSPYKTIEDLVAAAKGGQLKASTNGVKASNHTAAQLFSKSAGFNYKAIPYGGTADQLLALRQGEVDFTCAKVADVAPLIGGDKPELKVLAIFDKQRDPTLPDVPTLGEKGYYPDWYGSARALVAPKGTPDDVVKYYVDSFKKVMTDPDTVAMHEKAGMTIDYKDNKQLGELLKEQEVFAKDVINKLYE